jgi:hypothetical protein
MHPANARTSPTTAAVNTTGSKEVTFHTPVILGSANVHVPYASEKVSYSKGDLLHEPTIPQECEHLPNGFLIDLPLTNVTAYVSEMLPWLPLSSDSELVRRLHAWLHLSSP